jgi:hypothetical protein
MRNAMRNEENSLAMISRVKEENSSAISLD